jgi:hypothetical protein
MRTPIPVDTGRNKALAFAGAERSVAWAIALAAVILAAIAA